MTMKSQYQFIYQGSIAMLFFLMGIIANPLNAQSIEEVSLALEKVRNSKQAKKLKEKNPDWSIQVISLKTDQLDEKLNSLDEGDTVLIPHLSSTDIYKLLDLQLIEEMRVRYVFLNGDVMNMKEIDALRDSILGEVKAGTPFEQLASEFTMDGNQAQGDLGWTATSTLVSDFVEKVKPHEVGDLFTLDIPLKNWYYVVLKTHDEREIKRIKLVRIKCPKTNE